MKKIIRASATAGLIIIGATSAIAQAPPKGTNYADCRANVEWYWFGYKTKTGSWKGTCRRKPGKFVKDGVDKTKKAIEKAKVKTKKSGDGGGS
jgi:hypothetical protein